MRSMDWTLTLIRMTITQELKTTKAEYMQTLQKYFITIFLENKMFPFNVKYFHITIAQVYLYLSDNNLLTILWFINFTDLSAITINIMHECYTIMFYYN